MKRQIKFRFWDIQNSKWEKDFGIYGDGIIGDFSECFHNTAGENGQHYVAQQYTGLKDKNGVDIYEGDVLKIRNLTQLGCVAFQYGCFGIVLEDLINGEEFIPITNEYYLHDLEIVGNVMENPELMSK